MALIDQIINGLEQLVAGYGELLELSQRMQEAIIKDDSNTIGELAKEQTELTNKLAKIEEERDAAVAGLAKEAGFDGAMRLKDVAAHAGSDKERVNELGAELIRILRLQQAVNEQNKALLELHFEYANFMIDNFLREPQLNNIYGDTGEIKEDMQLSHINSEV